MLVNTTNKVLIDLIKALQCFQSNVIASTIGVTRIEEGHSSCCFDVTFNKQRFFVKYVKQEIGINSEIIASVHTSSIKLSPRVVYSDKYWLVCEFVEGTSLECYTTDINEKISVCISLMKQCHAIVSELPIFNIFQTITEFCKNVVFSSQQQKVLLQVVHNIEKVDIERINRKQIVLCHGDLNFSNVLISTKSWLLDFECACSGEVEFDLAMFFAINELTALQQKLAIKAYYNENEILLDNNKLKSYLKAAYILNGLWYLNRSRTMNNVERDKAQFEMFEQQGIKQLSLFDEKFQVPTKLAELMR